jgi:hypothetical protein
MPSFEHRGKEKAQHPRDDAQHNNQLEQRFAGSSAPGAPLEAARGRKLRKESARHGDFSKAEGRVGTIPARSRIFSADAFLRPALAGKLGSATASIYLSVRKLHFRQESEEFSGSSTGDRLG